MRFFESKAMVYKLSLQGLDVNRVQAHTSKLHLEADNLCFFMGALVYFFHED